MPVSAFSASSSAATFVADASSRNSNGPALESLAEKRRDSNSVRLVKYEPKKTAARSRAAPECLSSSRSKRSGIPRVGDSAAVCASAASAAFVARSKKAPTAPTAASQASAASPSSWSSSEVQRRSVASLSRRPETCFCKASDFARTKASKSLAAASRSLRRFKTSTSPSSGFTASSSQATARSRRSWYGWAPIRFSKVSRHSFKSTTHGCASSLAKRSASATKKCSACSSKSAGAKTLKACDNASKAAARPSS
mmetsp:Transcript_29250/g.98580  ORF Transcript_29250/g.98580 Transcript_29250/m.98580 type:complete len:254 (+) Transcript_29250:682-1443(+)